eukprot:g7286.t1
MYPTKRILCDTMTVLFLFALLVTRVLSVDDEQVFTICSRVLTVQDTEIPFQSPSTPRFAANDPLGCAASLNEEANGVERDDCMSSSFTTRINTSSFVRNLNVQGLNGVLRAFAMLRSSTGKETKPLLCFQHNVTMGSSELADDSPRCVTEDDGVSLLFLTRQCKQDDCRASFLVLIARNCVDGMETTSVSSSVPESEDLDELQYLSDNEKGP